MEVKNDFNAREIESISILDKKTLEAHKDILPNISNKEYWLQGGACIIPIKKLDQSVIYGTSYGTDLDNVAGVRPIIEFHDPNRFIFKNRGDKMTFEGLEWTIVSKNEAVCDGLIGNSAYQTKPEILSKSDYDKYRYNLSDIKDFTDNWLEEVKKKEIEREEKETEYEEVDR